MPVLVTANLTDFDQADALGSPAWSASQGSPGVVTDLFREAIASIGAELRSATGGGIQYLWKTNTASIDLTVSGVHLYLWMYFLFIANLYDKAGGGIRLRVGDGTDWGDWVVAGKDTYPGGWRCYVADCAKAFDFDSGTPPDKSVITQIGLVLVFESSARNIESTFVDVIRFGDGITITSGPTDDITFEELFAYQDSNIDSRAFGIIRKQAGVYMAQGKLRFGDASGTLSVDFADVSKIVVFEDAVVLSTLYEIIIQGNGTGTTNVIFGTKSGGRGISGFTFRSEGVAKYDFTATDTDIDVLGLYGCIFFDADVISLPLYNVNKEMLSCQIEGCGQMIVSTCIVKYCAIISADDQGVLISSTSHYFSDNALITCPTGIHFDTAGVYSLVNVVFTNCTYDIENSVNAATMDSYGSGNRDSDQNIYSGSVIGAGQSTKGDGSVLSSLSFMLSKFGSPTGNAVAKVYAHTGTFGVDGKPTGAALATSENFDVSTLDGTPTLTKIPFEDEFTMVNTTEYFVVLEYSGGGASDYVLMGIDTSTPTDDGNFATLTGAVWTEDDTQHGVFYVRTGGIVKINASGTSNPGTKKYSGTPEGVTIIVNTKTLLVHCEDGSGVDIENVRVSIRKQSDNEEISGGLTNSSGNYTDTTYNYVGDVAVAIRARKTSSGTTRYVNFKTSGTIDSNGLTVNCVMQTDDIASA